MAPDGEPPTVGPTMPRIVIAGGGIAGLEALIALRHHLGTSAHIDLLEANVDLVERPMAVAQPFGAGAPKSFDLARIAADHDAALRPDLLHEVYPDQRRLRTVRGDVLDYNTLLVAIGGRADIAVPGALTFSGLRGVGALRNLLHDLAARRVQTLAFALPKGVSWPLPLYELALMTAEHLSDAGVDDARLVVVTPERDPLDVFGAPTAARIRALLAQRDVALREDAVPVRVGPGGLVLADGSTEPAERVVALPRLSGPWLGGLPHDGEGFIPTDEHGAVTGAPAVWAAGDATTFPIKQGGLAAQQADAAAEAIAAQLGADLVPTPFRPALRGLLLDPRGARVLDSEAGQTSDAALWWPASKVATTHLAPYLAASAATATESGAEDEIDVAALLLTLAERHAELGERALAVRCLDAAEQLRGDLPAGAVARRRELAAALG
jgi:sulfide:quinone oxidoreductase